MVYYVFLTKLGGLEPEKVDKLDTVRVQELLYIASCVDKEQERELNK